MKNETVSKLLGLTQLELAMLLGVSRARISMFESGRRDLPAPAMQQLAEMLKHVNASDISQKPASRAHVAKKTKELLERELRENEFQKQKTMRAIAAVVRKMEAAKRIAALADFRTSHATGRDKQLQSRFELLNRKISNAPEKDQELEMMALQLKLDLLGAQENFLKERLAIK